MKLISILKNILARSQHFFSFTAGVRWGLIAFFLFFTAALALDIFIFYRYSYRVVNLRLESATQSVKINRMGLQVALEVLDGRAEKFKELYGGDTTTSR